MWRFDTMTKIKSPTHGRSDDADAFLPDPQSRSGSHHRTGNDSLAEALGREFLSAATSGEEVTEDIRDELTTEELGGPFVVTRAREEFGRTGEVTDSRDGDPEAFPTTSWRPARGESFPKV
jgi:hypothetical protein